MRRFGDELLHALEHELLCLLLVARRLVQLGQHALVRRHLLDRVRVEHALEDEAEEVVAPAGGGAAWRVRRAARRAARRRDGAAVAGCCALKLVLLG